MAGFLTGLGERYSNFARQPLGQALLWAVFTVGAGVAGAGVAIQFGAEAAIGRGIGDQTISAYYEALPDLSSRERLGSRLFSTGIAVMVTGRSLAPHGCLYRPALSAIFAGAGGWLLAGALTPPGWTANAFSQAFESGFGWAALFAFAFGGTFWLMFHKHLEPESQAGIERQERKEGDEFS